MDTGGSSPLDLLPVGSVFEWHGIRRLPALCADLGVSRPLLVTDRGLAGSALVADVVAVVEAAGIPAAVFTGIDGNPLAEQVEQGAAAFVAGGHDGVVALGGGSALDAGKAIAFAPRQRHPLHAFAFDRHGADGPPAAEPAMPWIAVPTTAGTGSEVSPSAVITDADGAKRSIMHPATVAPRVLCDPALTVGLPPDLTAWTGVDALSHCLEAFCAPGDDAAADVWALAGVRRVERSLVRACAHGDDRDARSDMMAAATLGAAAFRKGLGGLHALSHALAARFGGQHGLLNAVLLPHVLAANRPVIDARLAAVAATLDLTPACADSALDWLDRLLAALGIPASLAAIGLEWGDPELKALCLATAAEPNAATNPRPVDAAWAGRVLAAAVRPGRR